MDNADALFGLASILCHAAMARACADAEMADGAMSMDSVTEFFFVSLVGGIPRA